MPDGRLSWSLATPFCIVGVYSEQAPTGAKLIELAYAR